MRSAMHLPRRRCRTSTIRSARSNTTWSWKWRREFWQNPEVLKELYVSTSGGAVSAARRPRRPWPAPRYSSRPRRPRHRGLQHRRRAGRGAQSGGEFAGQCGPRQYLDRLGRQRRRRNRRAVFGVQSLHHRHHAGERQPHRHFGIDIHCLQSARRRNRWMRRWPRSQKKMSDIHVPIGIMRRNLRHRPPVSAEQQQYSADAGGRPARHLRGAGRALRKLQPAADDTLDPALGRASAHCWR